ncbi:MAG: FtsX-like permease family protein [Clostridiaceae bacterium]
MNIMNRVTWNNLKKNKTRTFVTIIGIMLSVSLLTAVATSVNSLQAHVIDVVKEENGDFHGALLGVNQEILNKVIHHKKIQEPTTIQNLGYAIFPDIKNDEKPYIFVGAMDANFSKKMPVYLNNGRMPQNDTELLLPEHLASNGSVYLKLGDRMTLELGERTREDLVLGQTNPFEKDSETLNKKTVKTYTVVGFYDRPSFEEYDAPGYTALTRAAEGGANSYDVYFQVHPMKDTYTVLQDFGGYGSKVNDDLLRFTGNSDMNSLNAVLYGMLAILSGIIMVGSVALIYNSFSISINERTKQFGLLKSVGATKKQILNSVIFEGLIVSGIGIPLGILLGLVGISITFELYQVALKSISGGARNGGITLRILPGALLFAALLGLITVLLSAYLPARKAAKKSAIDSIRQSDTIKMSPKQVKTSKLAYKFFGFDGMIAAKNFKRNKRKYRATVASLFMSIVLFISASSFTAYLKKSANYVFPRGEFDILYVPGQALRNNTPEKIRQLLSPAEGIEKSSYSHISQGFITVPTDAVGDELSKLFDLEYIQTLIKSEKGLSALPLEVIFIDDTNYQDLLQKNGLSKEEYMSVETPKGLLYTRGKIFSEETSKYHTFEILNKDSLNGTWTIVPDVLEDNFFSGERRGDQLVYISTLNNQEILVPAVGVLRKKELDLGVVIDELPMMAIDDSRPDLKVIYPWSVKEKMDQAEEGDYIQTTMYFKAKDHAKAFNDMTQLLKNQGLPYSGLFDEAAQRQQTRSVISVINVFAFGFIILISLIAVANVFNTISTNIHLRRREFAMLKTMGMTTKGFNKMIIYESLLYGIKSILYGVPVAIGITYLIYRVLSRGVDFKFFIPWGSAVIAVLSVFIVVFATSFYAMRTIKKDNPIDALKNENL